MRTTTSEMRFHFLAKSYERLKNYKKQNNVSFFTGFINYLPIYPTYLPIYPTYLLIYLPIYLPIYLSIATSHSR